MFTDYENKEMRKKKKKSTKLMIRHNGLIYERKVQPGDVVSFQDGTLYLVAEDGSLRRLKTNT
jgi:signal peptidase I